MKTLLFQGDSITDCGRTAFGDGNNMGMGYPSFIAAQLLGDHPEKNWNIINRGISGDRIVDLYARWKKDTLNLKPDILSILIGVNDTLHERNQNGVDVPRYDKFYRMLMDWTLEILPDIKIILMEPFAYPFGYVEEFWIPEINARQEVVRKIAEEYHTAFTPLQDIFNDALNRAPREYWIGDGVHPSSAGHRLIQKAWLETADDLVK